MAQFSVHGSQSSPQVDLPQGPCLQEVGHLILHGRHSTPHGPAHGCPHGNGCLHFSAQALCTRPDKQPPHVPLHLCPHSKRSLHLDGQRSTAMSVRHSTLLLCPQGHVRSIFSRHWWCSCCSLQTPHCPLQI